MMERLSDQAIEIINELHTERLDYSSEYIPLIDAANRLAAYEDTGLLPEDFKKAFNEDALLKMTAQYLGTTPDRLREWAKADKEDRLVALPCKVGDTVYIPVIEKRTVARVRVQGISISVSGRTILRFGGYPIGSVWGNGCGKDWFLTRKEAETALAGERKDGEG